MRLAPHAAPSQAEKGQPRSALLPTLLFSLAAGAVSAWLHFRTALVAETDIFYHFGAYVSGYAAQGPLASPLPRLAFSPLGRVPGDMWYGFHLLLLPLSYLPDPVLRLKLTGVILLTALLVTSYLVLRRHQVILPFLWPFVMLFSLGMVTWRLTMARPQLLSITLSLALLSVLMQGSPWASFALSVAIPWAHLSFFWLPLVVALVATLTSRTIEKRWPWRRLAWVFLGVAVGSLLRPHPLGALKLGYLQVVQLMLARHQAQLRGAWELDPLLPSALYGFSPLFWMTAGTLLLVTLVLLVVRPRWFADQARPLLWASLGLSSLFLFMTVRLAARGLDPWAPFALLSLALGTTALLRTPEGQWRLTPLLRGTLLLGGIALTAGLAAQSLSWNDRLAPAAHVFPTRLQPAADWLRKTTQPDQIVFNPDTDSYGELAFWGAENRFINGMDPFFLYAFDPRRYWQTAHFLKASRPGWTSDAPELTPDNAEDAISVLTRDFGASYLLVRKRFAPALYDYARQEERLALRFDSPEAAIYEITPTRGKARP